MESVLVLILKKRTYLYSPWIRRLFTLQIERNKRIQIEILYCEYYLNEICLFYRNFYIWVYLFFDIIILLLS